MEIIYFNDIKMMLNEAQRNAVNCIEGPLMVIAGPGTGKTQLLSARVGNILESTDLLPENILCLTFTDSATVAMRKRLISFMGSSAYRIPIFTFHSFCQKIITDYQHEMGISFLEPVSDIEVINYYHKIIDKWEIGNPLKNYKVPYIYRKDIISLNKILKQERISKDYLFQLITDEIKALPFKEELLYKVNRGAMKKGELNPKKYEEALTKLQKLQSAAETCFEYREVLLEKGRYDFDDMILWVIDFLNSHPFALLRYQEQYQYIMVDEYQDTNKAQNELILLLASYWDSPNLMVVGDDDQSIYRFQGANVENLHAFESQFARDLQKIVLKENYRSSQLILDTSGSVISKNTTRLLPNKELLAKKNFASEIPLVIECPNEMYEAAAVFNMIDAYHKSGVPFSEMAVIYRNHKQVDRLQTYLNANNIPFTLKKRTNILEMPLIINIIELLRYISDEGIKAYEGEFRLFRILHFDFWEILPSDLAKLSLHIRKERLKWRMCLDNLAENSELRSQLSESSFHKLTKLASDLDYWIGKSFNLPLQQLVEKVIAKGGILSYVLQSPQKRFLLQSLQTFFDYLKNETRRNPELSLDEFLTTIQLMKENFISLETEEIVEKTDGVNLLTAHASKGLEFEKVFIIGCNEKLWDKENDRLPFGLRELITHNTDSLTEENRRLFYVACTRAKSGLFVLYNDKDLNLKELQESVFVNEFLESGIPQKIKAEITEDQILEIQLALFNENEPDKDFEPLDAHFLNEFTENYVLSATHLDNYLECPVKFYYRNLLQIPSAKTGPLSFGNAIHKSLELFFKTMVDHPEHQYPEVNQMVSWFRFDLEKNKDSFTKEDFNRMIEYGSEKVLPALYTRFIDEWNANKNRIPEKNLADVVVNHIPIKGKLDQLVFLDKDHVHVIDFKTGKFTNDKKKTLQPPVLGIDAEKANYEDLYGGNYWRQVAFYHLLLNNDPLHSYETVSGEMFFIEPDAKGNFTRATIYIKPEELDFMETLIADVYHKIKNHEFNQGCGKKDCEWCNFNTFYLKRQVYTSETLLQNAEE